MVEVARRAGHVARWCLGVVLGVAGIGKVASGTTGSITPTLFERESVWYVLALAVEHAVPYLELLCAWSVMVVGGALRTLGCIGALLLGAVFILVGVLQPENANCSCFGVIGGLESRSSHLAVACIVEVVAGVATFGAFVAKTDERRAARELCQ
jgi:hypothetical protein